MPTLKPKSTKSSELETVSDVETAKAVFVARAVYIAGRRGYTDSLRRAMRHVNLEDYLASSNNRFTVNTSGLFEAIGETLNVEVEEGYTPASHHRRVSDLVLSVADKWARSLTDTNWTQPEASPHLVDTEAVGQAYGYRGVLPPVAGDEITQTWRDLVMGILGWADDTGQCSEVEDMLQAIGFGDFLPAREVTVTVEWEGLKVENVSVPANRKGEPRMDHAAQALIDRLYANRNLVKVSINPA